jgi:hypothetical protein
MPAPRRAARVIKPALVPMIPEANTNGLWSLKFKKLQLNAG